MSAFGRWTDILGKGSTRRRAIGVLALAATILLVGCDNMRQQPYQRPLTPSKFFADGTSYRTPPANTVARGQLREDAHFYQGIENGALAKTFPIEITPQVLARGQERYNIFCSPCHGLSGYGDGMIAQRGFKKTPPSFHDERLRTADVGHFFNAMTNGFGVMYDYADRIPPADRWAIAAYIRALQLSQHATLAEVPADVVPQLQSR